MKILVIRVKGIGNMVMFTPTLKAIRKNYPDAQITLLADKGSAEIIKGGELVNKVVLFDPDWNLIRQLKIFLKLRTIKFDFSIMSFPANKWQFNLLAFIVGAKKRVTHSFKNNKLRTLHFLQNTKLLAVEGIHDVYQNLNLLSGLEISSSDTEQKVFFSKDDEAFADKFLKNHKRVIAMHPGCGDDSLYKRWPAKHFSKLIELLQKEKVTPLVVGGPGEGPLIEEITRGLKLKPLILKDVSLKKTIAVISKCSLFLSTDSGLGHIASACNVPTAVIIGPTDYRRIAPFGAEVITKKFSCSPCKKYPFHTDFSHIKCKDIRCLQEISPLEVRDKLVEHKLFKSS